jgi:hypothetical protein
VKENVFVVDVGNHEAITLTFIKEFQLPIDSVFNEVRGRVAMMILVSWVLDDLGRH